MIEVQPISGCDIRCVPGGWPFAEAERRRIAEHWRGIAAANPHVWNGAVLICTEAEVRGGLLHARLAATDYASFVAWRDWGWPDATARNCFGVGVLKSADGALLYGIMSERTLNPGRSFPPSGSLELRDVNPDGTVDIFGSMRRELQEETGLDFAAATPAETLAIFDDRRLAVVRLALSPEPYDALAGRALRHIGAERHPELATVEAVRSVADIGPRMPPYAQEIARRFLGR